MDSETAEQSPVRNSQKSCRNRKDLRESIPVGLFFADELYYQVQQKKNISHFCWAGKCGYSYDFLEI